MRQCETRQCSAHMPDIAFHANGGVRVSVVDVAAWWAVAGGHVPGSCRLGLGTSSTGLENCSEVSAQDVDDFRFPGGAPITRAGRVAERSPSSAPTSRSRSPAS
jgi:hypothetical protein